MIKRLIFDVDNTLIVGANFKDAVEKTLKDLNIYSEKNVENFFKGIFTYESIYNNYNYKDYKKHMEKCMNVSIPNHFFYVFFYYLKDAIPKHNDRLIHTIDTLSKKYELVLLTNYFGISQINRLNNMGIGKYFTEVYGEKLIKPNNGAYIKACGSCRPEECVMIGDSLYLDVECAQNNGLKAIFINTNGILTDHLEVMVIDKVEDINEDRLKELNQKKLIFHERKLN